AQADVSLLTLFGTPLLAHSGHSNRDPECLLSGVKRTLRVQCEMSAYDAVDGASSAASKCYRLVASKPKRFKEVRPGNLAGLVPFGHALWLPAPFGQFVKQGTRETAMGPSCYLEIQSAWWASISKTPLKLVGRGITSIRCALTWSPMSTSLIGRLRSSAFRLSTTPVSMSLAGSCFSSDSALRPFQYGIRRRGGTIFRSALPSDQRQVQADIRTHLIHRPARDIIPPCGGARVFSC